MSNPSDEPGPPPNPPVQYRFIDGSTNTPENLTQVKRHVMREFVRQKRWRAKQRGEAAGQTEEENQDSSRDRSQRRSRPRRTAAQSDRTTAGRSSDADAAQIALRQQERSGKSRATGDQDEDDNIEDIGRGWNTGYTNPWTPSTSTSSSDPNAPIREGLGTPAEQAAIGYRFHREASDPGFWSGSGSSDRTASRSPSASAQASRFRLSPSPQSMLSAARTDPFDSLPLPLDEEGKVLFDFYANVMPACSYGFHARSPKGHNWYSQVFIPEAMKGAITFQNTILVHAANTQAWVRGLTETKAALIHRARGISMLRKHFAQYPTDISDAAISATLSATAVEDFDPRVERKPISWIHMRAAIQKIRDRGGPAAFEHNRRLAMLINWQDYILAGYETNGPSFFYEHTTSIPQQNNPPSSTSLPAPNLTFPSPPTSISPSPAASSLNTPPTSTTPVIAAHPTDPNLIAVSEIRSQCEEFIAFLRRSERLAFTHKNSPVKHLFLSRYSTFQPNTLIFRILSSPPGIRYSIPGERKQIIARLAALMTINTALWDNRLSTRRTEMFLRGLNRRLLDSEVDVNASVEALLQILLECDDAFGTQEEARAPAGRTGVVGKEKLSPSSSTESPPWLRPWFVGRMLKIAKRLGRPSWERLNATLYSFLTLSAETPTIASWENELRREILAAPLTSYIMPILQ
ncbi:hypothetical protein AJ80_09348 [Polytolypa hystricis UAMH7299]|uniref:Sigma-70 region 2 family protein n=1 Tax=Polytolypa hystricis (strain UAMH7299) TaxID=1447883 RepID=A0A2B7WS76_POLH7|nr:hypothetical protein AJ80_09348 [Polytolypa hystricis UAMH7299]